MPDGLAVKEAGGGFPDEEALADPLCGGGHAVDDGQVVLLDGACSEAPHEGVAVGGGLGQDERAGGGFVKAVDQVEGGAEARGAVLWGARPASRLVDDAIGRCIGQNFK